MHCRVSCLVFKFVFMVCIDTHRPIKIKSGPRRRLTLDMTEIRPEKVLSCSCITSSASLDLITVHHTLCYFDPYNMPNWTLVGPDWRLYVFNGQLCASYCLILV